MCDYDYLSVEEQDALLASIIEETILLQRREEIYNEEDEIYVL